ncbi:MAG: ankyrin repeat domain-containing protein [Synergistaceae bacterium]|nr:ankyrin repeat domain-containing protein [Synergistaceae bacterium]
MTDEKESRFPRISREEIRNMFTPEDFVTRPEDEDADKALDNAEEVMQALEDLEDALEKMQPQSDRPVRYHADVVNRFKNKGFFRTEVLPCIEKKRPFTLEVTLGGHVFLEEVEDFPFEVLKHLDGKSWLSFDELSVMLCVYTRNNDRLSELLDAHREINLDAKATGGVSALELAINRDNAEAIELLLTHGADPNIEHSRGGGVFWHLVWSLEGFAEVEESAYESVETMLAHGADVNSRNDRGETCLSSLCGIDGSGIPPVNLRLIEILVKHGADVNSLNAEGKTPLTSCIESAGNNVDEYNFEAIKLLVESGADVNMKDGRGITPLMCKVSEDCCYDSEIIEYLVTHGAKE